MGHRITASVMLLAILVFAVGCGTATSKSAGETIDDATITATVKSKLVAERAANLTGMDVDTVTGTVSLNGSAKTDAQKASVETIAREVRGVQRVVNNLQVERR